MLGKIKITNLENNRTRIDAQFNKSAAYSALDRADFIHLTDTTGHWVGHTANADAVIQKLTNDWNPCRNFEIVETFDSATPIVDFNPTAQAINMLDKMTDIEYERWNARELARQSYPKKDRDGSTYMDPNTQTWDD